MLYHRIGSIQKWRVECSWGAALSRLRVYHGLVVLAPGDKARCADSFSTAGLIYLKPEAELPANTDLCTFVFGESKASMYVKYKSLIASFMIERGRLEWSDRTRDNGSPQRLLTYEETVCVAGALIAWSHDSAGSALEFDTCDVQRRLAEGVGIWYIEDNHRAVIEEGSATREQESAQR